MSESKELAVRQMDFDEIERSVHELDKFYRKLMQKGTDYDVISGTPKPTLLKAGAELLRLRFGYSVQFSIDKGLTDINKGFIEYDVKCTLKDREGNIVAEGVGNANSLETKWRYRWVSESEITKGLNKNELPFRWIKKDNKKLYRIENENPQDLANTILKVAKKRSFVDAILTATGASRIFTQDIEDLDDVIIESTETAQTETEQARPKTSLIEVTKIHGAVEVVSKDKFPKLFERFPYISFDACWEHNEPWQHHDTYGLYHKTTDGHNCYLRNKIRDIAIVLTESYLGFSSHESPVLRKDGKSIQYISAKFKEWLKKEFNIDDWNKLEPVEQLKVLETIIP